MKKLILLVILGGALVSAGRWRRTDHSVGPAAELLVDRLWIDHVPRTDRDTIQVFVAISEESVGAFNASSAWRGSFELFRYESHGGELRLVFPQTGERATVHAKARRCSENQMDFCLELDGTDRGVKKYYSRKGWEIDGGSDADAIKRRVEALRGQLAAGQ